MDARETILWEKYVDATGKEVHRYVPFPETPELLLSRFRGKGFALNAGMHSPEEKKKKEIRECISRNDR